MMTLYQQGFYQIGHIQTGNIFMDGESCCLGGYENTVFGYKTRLFRQLTGRTDRIDLIMFGKGHQTCLSLHMFCSTTVFVA